MDAATHTAANAKEHLATGLHRMVDEADQLLQTARSTGDRKIDEARVRIEHQLDQLRLQIDDLEGKAVYRARRAARATDEAVHAHPYRAMGAAAATAALIAWLFARR